MAMCERHNTCNTERGELICSPYVTYPEVVNCNCVYETTTWSSLPLQPRTKGITAGSVSLCHQFEPSLENKFADKVSVPRTMFCHDLKGGYLEDRFVNGSTTHEEYRFFHWAGIDIFVYFSHRFITIPPPVWVTAAHLHGVKILGTVITEWKDGEAIWKEVLGSDDSVLQFADRLVDICLHFSFDGYLLNVENVIDKDSVLRLETFVKLLSTKLKQKVPHGEVIWYDSVTVNGNLKWQDELNDLNRTFFDCCDGIFLNYCWTDEKLKKSVENAGSRKHDVYVGVDVFGRGCFGGGGFNTCKAMEVVRSRGLSVALFAPSWVHEFLGKDNFATHEYVFWQKLWPFLYLHGPQKLPFSTSFCQGFGSRVYHCGTVISDPPWYNLSRQQYQPCVTSCLSDECIGKFSQEEKAVEDGSGEEASADDDLPLQVESHEGCVQHCQDDGFCGGGCLEIKMPAHCGSSSRHTILLCNFVCNSPLLVTVATKTRAEGPNICLLLAVDDMHGTRNQLLVLSDDIADHKVCQEDNEYFVEPLPENKIHRLHLTMELLTGSCGWIVRHYELNINGTITKIGAELHGSGGSALLGYLSLSHLGFQHENS